MPPKVLLDRQLSRVSGAPYSRIRERKLTDADKPAVHTALATLAEISDRVTFLTGAFDLAGVVAAGDGCDADLILIDYLQRLGATGQHRDKRSQTNAVLDAFRGFAESGRGLLVLSSVGRQPDKKGKSGYTGLSLASFKESGDIEYSADDAFLLTPPEGGWATLSHVKARHTEMADIPLRCDLSVMRFESDEGGAVAGDRADLLGRARKMWANGKPKGDA